MNGDAYPAPRKGWLPEIRRQDLTVAAAFSLIVVLWSMMIPFHGAPDEFTHLYLVEYLYKYGSIPVPGVDPAQPFSGELSGWNIVKDQFWYFGLPYLNSLGATVLAELFAGFLPQNSGYLAARAFNWLLAPIFALSLLAIARRCGLRGSLAVMPPILFLLVPQATFLFSYFNADAFALTVTSLTIALFLGAASTPTTLRAFLFGIGCGLILCSKVYYQPALVFFAGLLVVRWWADRSFPIGRFLLATTIGALLIAVPVLGTTYLQFGEVTGLRGQMVFSEKYLGQRAQLCFILCEAGIIDSGNVAWWLHSAFKSFFYGLGWMRIFLPNSAYLFFFLPLVVTLLLASVVMSWRELGRKTAATMDRLWIPAMTLLFWGMAVSVILLNLIGSQNFLPQPQGRYIYVLFPFALLLVSTLIARSSASMHPKADR